MEHKHYTQACRAYTWSYMNPEKHAARTCQMYDQHIAELTALGGDIEKYERLFLAWLAAESRCASPMVTGPAKFPVERNRKAMDSARKKWGALEYFLNKTRNPRPAGPMRTELDYAIEEKRYTIGDVEIWQNVEQNRLQIIYPGKPDAETIERLKRNGYKWSPRNTAWQRQLTPNALRSLKTVLSA